MLLYSMPRIVKKISIRRLPEDYSYNEYLASSLNSKASKIQMPSDCCVLTATNKRHFVGLQLLYTALFLTHKIDVVVMDLGMTPKQLDWCRRQKRLIVLKYNNSHPKIFYWQAWAKPLYLLECPYKTIIWLDADGVWKSDLRLLLEFNQKGPVFTADHTVDPKVTLNFPELYTYLPVPSYKQDRAPYLNTGLFVVDRERDRTLINEWCYIVMEALYCEHIATSIACWDQGGCKWALQQGELVNRIYTNKNFNHPALDREMFYPAQKEAVLQLIHNIWKLKDACFVHWMGSPKPWLKWGEVINLDFSVNH